MRSNVTRRPPGPAGARPVTLSSRPDMVTVAVRYRVSFTGDEMARLRRIFPEGACDWGQPGVAQRKPLGPWHVVPSAPGPGQ